MLHTHAENVYHISDCITSVQQQARERNSDAAHQHFPLQQHLGLLLENITAVDKVYCCTATQTLRRKHTHTHGSGLV